MKLRLTHPVDGAVMVRWPHESLEARTDSAGTIARLGDAEPSTLEYPGCIGWSLRHAAVREPRVISHACVTHEWAPLTPAVLSEETHELRTPGDVAN